MSLGPFKHARKVHECSLLHKKWIIFHSVILGLQKTHETVMKYFTFKDFLIKCVDALGDDDRQGGSTQQPGSQHGHQLQLLLQKNSPR